MNQSIINLKNVCKKYSVKKESLSVLNNLNYSFEKGKFYAIMGHSGSGKSTLINILGLIDFPTSGDYILINKNIHQLADKELSYLRMKNIGFIYQDFQLVQTLTAIENIMLPMIINKAIKKEERLNKANKLLSLVNLEDRKNHFPSQMSGGEQQRIAIARSLSNNPTIILADEPTGNLDEENEKDIFLILKHLAEIGKCVIVVSHSNEIKQYANIILKLEKGTLKEV